MELENDQQALVAALQMVFLAPSKGLRERAIDVAYHYSQGMTTEQIEACKLIAKTAVELELEQEDN